MPAAVAALAPGLGPTNPRYLAYQAAAFVLMNLGEDVALAALLFVN